MWSLPTGLSWDCIKQQYGSPQLTLHCPALALPNILCPCLSSVFWNLYVSDNQLGCSVLITTYTYEDMVLAQLVCYIYISYNDMKLYLYTWINNKQNYLYLYFTLATLMCQHKHYNSHMLFVPIVCTCSQYLLYLVQIYYCKTIL